MKKILLLSIITCGLLSFTTIKDLKQHPVTKSISSVSHHKKLDCNYGQCQAIAKSTGKQCRHCVSNSGDSYCWQHK
jgi:hypothetical protein